MKCFRQAGEFRRKISERTMIIKPDINKDGTFKALPASLQINNALLAMGGAPINPLTDAACAQWLYNTWRASKDGKVRWPAMFDVYLFLTGESAAHVRERLAVYGIPTQMLQLEFELWPDKKGVGLAFLFWVPATMAGMADDILRQGDGHGSTYMVRSRRYGTGATFSRPWGVPAMPRSWEEAVTTFLFGAIYGKSSMRIKTEKTKGEGKLQTYKTDDKPKTPITRRRTPAKRKPSAIKKVTKAIWNA